MRVLITGAAAGLAQGFAVALAGDGHEIVFTYRPAGTPPERTLALVSGVRGGGAAVAEPLEFLGHSETVEAALADVVARRGPFDALVHAVGPMRIARFASTDRAQYEEMIDGNLRSAVLAAAAVLPAMRARKFGRIVVFGVNGSHVTQPTRGLSLHLAAKAGVVAFARALALEEARAGITVNVVEPGDIREKSLSRADALERTASNPRGRPGTWEDVAGAVRFLLDERSDFVNGAVLSVTGGLIAPYERNAAPP